VIGFNQKVSPERIFGNALGPDQTPNTQISENFDQHSLNLARHVQNLSWNPEFFEH
jgi:hypothetical protein